MKPYLEDPDFTLYQGSALDVARQLAAESVDCIVTSPPYVTRVLAYLAGAIDSDGSIGVKRSRSYSGGNGLIYSERLQLRQVTPEIPMLLRDTFGGALYTARYGRVPLHGWTATDLKAAHAIKALLPYLLVKREQALNCLELRAVKDRSKKARVACGRGHVGASARPLDLSEAMEACYQRAKLLNAPKEVVTDGQGLPA